MFNRIGLVNFGKPNGNGTIKELRTLSDVQISQGQILKAHEKRLDEGEDNFKDIGKDISLINQNIAVLLDRSDGRKGAPPC